MEILCIRIGLLILAVLGALHLKYTFADLKRPRYFVAHDKNVLPLLQNTHVKLVRNPAANANSFWRSYMGFHMSHSVGILIFAAIYMCLSFIAPSILFHPVLAVILVGTGAAYSVMAHLFWFNIPFWGASLATTLFAIGVGAYYL